MPDSPARHRLKHRKRTHRGRHRAPSRTGVHLPGLVLASCLIGSTAVFTASGAAVDPADQQLNSSDVTALLADRTAEEKDISRSLERDAAASPTPSPEPTPEAKKMPPDPVAGLNGTQMNNAAIIVQVGQSMGLPKRALIIGVATAMQESNLYNNASEAVPASLNYPHEGTSTDHDSVGVFQQRPSAGWGTVENLMKPAYQAEKFFSKLIQLDWESMSLSAAAQAVQISAYPSAYAKHETRATEIVSAFV